MTIGRTGTPFQASSSLRPSKVTGSISLRMTTGVWERVAIEEVRFSWEVPGVTAMERAIRKANAHRFARISLSSMTG
jgi:hypothetical protein